MTHVKCNHCGIIASRIMLPKAYDYKKRIYRKKISNIFIYFSPGRSKRQQQITLRKSSDSLAEFDQSYEIDVFRDELKAAIILFYSLLNEKQRRLYAGLESFKLGHGGDNLKVTRKKIADFLGLDSHTITKGRRELLGGNIRTESVREKGGGHVGDYSKILSSL